jgi:hypothetical protein
MSAATGPATGRMDLGPMRDQLQARIDVINAEIAALEAERAELERVLAAMPEPAAPASRPRRARRARTPGGSPSGGRRPSRPSGWWRCCATGRRRAMTSPGRWGSRGRAPGSCSTCSAPGWPARPTRTTPGASAGGSRRSPPRPDRTASARAGASASRPPGWDAERYPHQRNLGEAASGGRPCERTRLGPVRQLRVNRASLCWLPETAASRYERTSATGADPGARSGTTSRTAAQILVLDGSGSVRLALACPHEQHLAP